MNKTMIPDFSPGVMYSISYKYVDQKNLLEKYRFNTYTEDFETSFLYGDINEGQMPDAVYGVKLDDVLKIGYDYDGFARQNLRTLYTGNSSITTSYEYKSLNDGLTSCLVDTVTENGYIYSYTYDAVGNITAYTKTNAITNEVVETYLYQYDSKNQLTYVGSDLTSGISYTYDANGNILTKTDHSTNITITYGYTDSTWADLLTSYNGQTITYDAIGNPLQYNNGTAMTFEWIFGKNLYVINKGNLEICYAYDQKGTRTSKSYGDYYTSFHIVDDIMYGESTYGPDGSRQIYYFYDDNDVRYGFSYNGMLYYYKYNLQGDVTGIYNADGQLVVEYKYDAWGKVLSITGSLASTIGQYNPIRYRGYYYDSETGFYYISSRYYDPEIGRFINADTTEVLSVSPMSMADKNLFAYCDNNPIVRVDIEGNVWETVFDVISLGASVVEVAVNPTDPWAWASLAGDVVDLIPFVSGVGEVTRAVKTVDKVKDTVQIAKAVDFTEDAANIVKTLDRSSGFTKSTVSAGRKIHKGYKATDNFLSIGKEYSKITGIRPDYIDFATKTIYELKPMNPKSIKSGIRQLQKYNKYLGGGYLLRLELY